MWKKLEFDGESFGVYNANGHLVVRHKERNATVTQSAGIFTVVANYELHKAPNLEQATHLACNLLLRACASPISPRKQQPVKIQDFFDRLEVLQHTTE